MPALNLQQVWTIPSQSSPLDVMSNISTDEISSTRKISLLPISRPAPLLLDVAPFAHVQTVQEFSNILVANFADLLDVGR